MEKINRAILYYEQQMDLILHKINHNDKSLFNADQIIDYGKQLYEITLKISALEIAKNN